MSIISSPRVDCSIPLRIKEDFDFSGSIFRFAATREWWSQRNRTSVAGVIYVYTDYIKTDMGKYIPGVKIGDGKKTIGNLPFVAGWKDVNDAHIADKDIHITAEERKYWNDNIAQLLNVTSGVMHDIGITDSEITDRSTKSPITLDGEWYYPQNGDVVTYGDVSYMWCNGEWDQQGSAGPLKALAYKDYCEANYLPHGTVEAPEFKGEKTPINIRVSATGTISAPDFKGREKEVHVKGTPTGDISISQEQQTISQITDVGTSPTWSYEIDDETLKFSWDPGTLPTRESVTLDTKVSSAQFSGNEMESMGDFTPEGDVSAPEFTGDNVATEGYIVPRGTVTAPKFHGTRERVVSK